MSNVFKNKAFSLSILYVPGLHPHCLLRWMKVKWSLDHTLSGSFTGSSCSLCALNFDPFSLSTFTSRDLTLSHQVQDHLPLRTPIFAFPDLFWLYIPGPTWHLRGIPNFTLKSALIIYLPNLLSSPTFCISASGPSNVPVRMKPEIDLWHPICLIVTQSIAKCYWFLLQSIAQTSPPFIVSPWTPSVQITIGSRLSLAAVGSWLLPLSFLSYATCFLLSPRMTVLRHKVDHITHLLKPLQRLCVGLILPKRPSMVWPCHLTTCSSPLFSRGWIISSQMIYLIQPPVAVTMTLFGNKVFVDLIKVFKMK